MQINSEPYKKYLSSYLYFFSLNWALGNYTEISLDCQGKRFVHKVSSKFDVCCNNMSYIPSAMYLLAIENAALNSYAVVNILNVQVVCVVNYSKSNLWYTARFTNEVTVLSCIQKIRLNRWCTVVILYTAQHQWCHR